MNIIVKTGKVTKQILGTKDKSILNLLHENNLYISALCGGRGTCGKCKIRVLNGRLPISPKDESYFSKSKLDKGFRLACAAYPQEDVEIMIEASEEEFEAVTGFEGEDGCIDSGFRVMDVDLRDINWQKVKSIHSAIESKLDKSYTLSYKALKNLSFLLNSYMQDADKKPLQLLVKGTTVLDVFYERDIEAYGIAIDIGTTTLGFHLVDLLAGRIKGSHSLLNTQRMHGADVITRIQNAASGGLEQLKHLIMQDILEGISCLLEDGDCDNRFVYSVTTAGNTTMMHLLLGLSPESLGQFPFASTTLSLMEQPFEKLFGSSLLDCEVIVFPGMDAYVGADIVAGIFHHRMFKTDQVNMLIDIGTNGEIVIGNRDRILATATAAGPAFEGGNISCGTGCIAGAIAALRYNKDAFDYEVIGNREPFGICGSGVIDTIAEGLKIDWIDMTGRLSEAFSNGEIPIYQNESGVSIKLSQKDIREIQLAKSALRSGVECLIKVYGIDYDGIDHVYLAGGFGSNLSIENTVRIGLIPEELKDKIVISGNTCLGGLVKYLLNQEYQNDLESIFDIASAINLSNDPDFNSLFIENMYF
ncbi:MAG: ASKHA domain-containing protein [Bacillota bacterium]